MLMDLRLTLLTLLTGLVVCQGDIGRQLVDAMNAARAKSGLPKIPYSPKLSKVAQTHCDNLASYSPNTSNPHSWFGPLACDFNSNLDCMWDKAKSVGGYAGKGYEILLKGSIGNVDSMISSWLSSSAHKGVILNQDTWAQMKWNAVGGGQKGEFATMWFGTEKDDSSPSDSNQQSKPENNQQQQQAPENNQQQQQTPENNQQQQQAPENNQQQQQAPENNQQQQQAPENNQQQQQAPENNQQQQNPSNDQPQGMPNNNQPQEIPNKGDSNGFQPMPNQPNYKNFKPVYNNVQKNKRLKSFRPYRNKRPISIPNFNQNQNDNNKMRPISIPSFNKNDNMNRSPQQNKPSSQQSWSLNQNGVPGSQQNWFNFPKDNC